MSRCISSRGEYSEHTFPHPKAAARGEDRFTCTLCGDFDESAAMGALRTAEAIAEAAREWAKADREVVDAIGQGGPNGWRRWANLNAREKSARAALRAAVDAEREAQSATHPNPQP